MFREGFIPCFCFSQVLFNFVHISFHFLLRFILLFLVFLLFLFLILTFCSFSFSTFISSFSFPFLLVCYLYIQTSSSFWGAHSCARFFKRFLPFPSFFLFSLLSLPPNLDRRSHHVRHQSPLV